MGHDSELYQVNVGHKTPAETKATEDAQNAATRDLYQAAQRSTARQFSGFTGGSGDPYVPVLGSIAPSTKAAGTGAFVLTCTGSNFSEDSKVFWNTTQLATTYGSATSLTADVPASLIAAAATAQVTVKTDSSVSTNKPFTIT
jgi:hypothetical protein